MQEEKHRRVYADVAQMARERALVPGDAGSIPAIRANRSRVTDAAIIPGVKIGGPVTVRIGGTGPISPHTCAACEKVKKRKGRYAPSGQRLDVPTIHLAGFDSRPARQ